MFKFSRRTPSKPHIDLETVRETLEYIESDCRDRPGLEGLGAALAVTLAEIERLQDGATDQSKAQKLIAASFIPAGLTARL